MKAQYQESAVSLDCTARRYLLHPCMDVAELVGESDSVHDLQSNESCLMNDGQVWADRNIPSKLVLALVSERKGHPGEQLNDRQSV